MPRTLHTNVTRHTYKHQFWPIYAATLLLIFHSYLVAYINSSFLSEFIPDTSVGMIYTVGSALTVLIFLFVSRVLHRVGNYKLTMLLLLADFLAVAGMSMAESLRVAIPLFMVHIISVALLIFNIDVFLESLIGNNEGVTGSRRGLILTLSSLIGAISPFLSSLLVTGGTDEFSLVYKVSAATLVPVMFIFVWFFRDFCDPPYREIKVFSAIRTFWIHRDVRYVFLAHFLLQTFFMYMVVYVPLYLTGTIGLSWTDFGVIMLVAQMAYVILEYPVGIIADRYIGEKEMMAVGFLIIALSTASLAYITSVSVMVWATVMFISRVGASLAEVTTEAYFFKQINGSDAQIISFFRVTRPLSYVLGALIGSLSLLYLPFNLIFVVAGLLMVPAIFFVANITDTR